MSPKERFDELTDRLQQIEYELRQTRRGIDQEDKRYHRACRRQDKAGMKKAGRRFDHLKQQEKQLLEKQDQLRTRRVDCFGEIFDRLPLDVQKDFLREMKRDLEEGG